MPSVENPGPQRSPHNHLEVQVCHPDCPAYAQMMAEKNAAAALRDLQATTHQQLETVVYEFEDLQERAEALIPHGWCNACIAKAKAAQKAGVPAEKIYAAVTIVAQVTTISVPGMQGQQNAVMPLPTCIYCLGLEEKRIIQEAFGPLPS